MLLPAKRSRPTENANPKPITSRVQQTAMCNIKPYFSIRNSQVVWWIMFTIPCTGCVFIVFFATSSQFGSDARPRESGTVLSFVPAAGVQSGHHGYQLLFCGLCVLSCLTWGHRRFIHAVLCLFTQIVFIIIICLCSSCFWASSFPFRD